MTRETWYKHGSDERVMETQRDTLVLGRIVVNVGQPVSHR
jgi:hypothetical protein